MRTIIVDDERLARNELKRLLENFPKIEILAEASNADEALELIDEHQPDLIFLDIQMPGKNGFELLAEIQGKAPEVIFTTAYDEYAIKAFDYNAFDYLLKPIDQDRLGEAVKRLEEELSNNHQQKNQTQEPGRTDKILRQEDQVFVKDGEKCWFVKLEKVRLFESMGNYVRLHFDDQKPLVLKSLNSLEDRLDQETYFRANRKHIINLQWIEKIEPWFSGGLLVTLKGGDKIEISRRQAIRFKELMSL
jgi:two-component system LytT family response regulator